MANKHKEIKSSLLKRIITVPRLPVHALNIYNTSEIQNAGVIQVTIPNETYTPILVLSGSGTFNFGGIETSDVGVSITKIIIDNVTVFDSSLAGDVLKSVFSYDNNAIGKISANTPPYLVNEKIEIYATNENKKRGNNHSEIIFLSLVPIE